MQANEEVVGREKLIAVFGYWPSFHDGQLVSFSLDQAASELGEGPTMEAILHGFEISNETDARGYLVLRKHTLVRFRFAKVWGFRCDSFYPKHELSELCIEKASHRQAGAYLDIRMESVYGKDAAVFRCDRMEVVSVQACDAERRPLR